MDRIQKIEDLIARGGRFAPRWGFHDDHRDKDGTPEYLPALQQVRAEFYELVEVLDRVVNFGGSALQLGIGECRASHEVWACLFPRVVTIDWSGTYWIEIRGERPEINTDATAAGGDTHSSEMEAFARQFPPFDFLFIDAGHDYADVERDFADYGPLVRPGGIIAFHDSLPRKGYEEVEVWRLLSTLGDKIHQIGTEVGVAWMVKE
jgi:hypothetical protein